MWYLIFSMEWISNTMCTLLNTLELFPKSMMHACCFSRGYVSLMRNRGSVGAENIACSASDHPGENCHQTIQERTAVRPSRREPPSDHPGENAVLLQTWYTVTLEPWPSNLISPKSQSLFKPGHWWNLHPGLLWKICELIQMHGLSECSATPPGAK